MWVGGGGGGGGGGVGGGGGLSDRGVGGGGVGVGSGVGVVGVSGDVDDVGINDVGGCGSSTMLKEPKGLYSTTPSDSFSCTACFPVFFVFPFTRVSAGPRTRDGT